MDIKVANIQAMITSVNIAELKNKLAEYLALVERGESLVVCKRNVPIARVEPLKPNRRDAKGPMFGCMKGSVKILGDLSEPCIAEEDWEMLRP